MPGLISCCFRASIRMQHMELDKNNRRYAFQTHKCPKAPIDLTRDSEFLGQTMIGTSMRSFTAFNELGLDYRWNDFGESAVVVVAFRFFLSSFVCHPSKFHSDRVHFNPTANAQFAQVTPV